MKNIVSKDALEIAQENYRDYSLYVGQGRAYPNIKDGCKSSYKRAIYGMWKDGPRSIVKCAKLASYALPYHPHPSSISGVIIQLGDNGNKLKLMETQGNWGDSEHGIAPSADRYIGGMLSDLAIKLLCDSCEYTRMITGEINEKEPIALPALIPLCFINGLSGIPSGLPTLNIPTIDIIGMFDYYIDILKHKSLDYIPKKFPNPNLEINVLSTKDDWNTIMLTGKGSLRVAPIMEMKNNVITITKLPSSKSIDHIYKILNQEIITEKIDVRDESTTDTCIVIEKVPKKWCNMNEVYNKLYNKLQSSISYNMAFFDENKIYVPCGFDKVVKANLEHLIETHMNRISKQLDIMKNKLLVLQIIENLKTDNNLHELFKLNHTNAIKFISNKYNVSDDISNKVLQKPISYLTKEHDNEITTIIKNINDLENDQNDIYDYLLKKYKLMRKEMIKVIGNKFMPTEFIKQ